MPDPPPGRPTRARGPRPHEARPSIRGVVSDAGRLCWHERHPESGAAIAGVRVERWAETSATVLAAAARLPEAPAIGWDLVVTDDGCCFLEGNSPPGPFVWQVHGPLLVDPRVRRFYETHGVVRGHHPAGGRR